MNIREIQWLVDRVHVSTTNFQLVRQMRLRMILGPCPNYWTKDLRKQCYRIALKYHQENRQLYNFVTGSIV